MTHYNALMAMKAALEKAGKIDKESMIDALEGLTIDSPTGTVTIGKNHHATMNLFLAKTAKGQLGYGSLAWGNRSGARMQMMPSSAARTVALILAACSQFPFS